MITSLPAAPLRQSLLPGGCAFGKTGHTSTASAQLIVDVRTACLFQRTLFARRHRRAPAMFLSSAFNLAARQRSLIASKTNRANGYTTAILIPRAHAHRPVGAVTGLLRPLSLGCGRQLIGKPTAVEHTPDGGGAELPAALLVILPPVGPERHDAARLSPKP